MSNAHYEQARVFEQLYRNESIRAAEATLDACNRLDRYFANLHAISMRSFLELSLRWGDVARGSVRPDRAH